MKKFRIVVISIVACIFLSTCKKEGFVIGYKEWTWIGTQYYDEVLDSTILNQPNPDEEIFRMRVITVNDQEDILRFHLGDKILFECELEEVDKEYGGLHGSTITTHYHLSTGQIFHESYLDGNNVSFSNFPMTSMNNAPNNKVELFQFTEFWTFW